MRRIRTVLGSRVLICAVLLSGTACSANLAFAEPLGKDACAQLGAERDSLAKMGVELNMVKGPEWASANLPASGLDLIKRYIAVNEMIKFRCRSVVIAEPAPAAEPAEKPKPRQIERKANVARALPQKQAAPAQKPKAAGARPAAANSVETIKATVN